MQALAEVAFVAFFSTLAMVLGFGLLKSFGFACDSPLEFTVFALAIGLGAIAYWLFFDGILGLNAPWAGGLFLVAALSRSGLTGAAHHLPSLLRSLLKLREGGAAGWIGFALLPALLTLALIMALAPPVANDWDSLTYHLAIPKIFLRAKHLLYVPWSDHSNFPFTMEMLYLLGLQLSPVAAKLFHYVTFLLTLATILLFGRTFFSLSAGICGAILFATVPMALHEATTGYVDIALTAYGLLAFYCLLRWLERAVISPQPALSKAEGLSVISNEPTNQLTNQPTNQPYAILCGIFCGLSMGIKYTGLLIFALCIAGSVARLWRLRPRLRESAMTVRVVRVGLLSALLACVIASPWYLKNWINTRNPVFPFLYSVFDGRGWTREMAQQYTDHQREFGYDRTPTNLVLSPWRAAMWPWNFDREDPFTHKRGFETTPYPPSFGMIGPALLAFLLPLILTRHRSFAMTAILGSALAFFLIWFTLEQYNRYLFPGVGLLCVAAGHAAAMLLERNALTRIVVAVALVWSAVLAGGLLILFHPGAFRCGLGLESRRDYLYRLNLYPACERINEGTPQDAKVLLLGDERGFYLERDYIWGNKGHHTLLPYDQLHTAKDWWTALRSLEVNGQPFAITHLLVNETTIPPADRKWIDDGIKEGLFRFFYGGAGIAVYELK